MSAHAYIQYADVPQSLIDSSSQRIDSGSGMKLISLDGCPLVGQIEMGGDVEPLKLQIEFPFPRVDELRNDLVAWFMHHGISFTAVMS